MKAVFDTNVVVSALVFRQGRLTWLREAWKSGAVIPVVSAITMEELVRVLAYPKFGLSLQDRHELLGEYLPYAEVIDLAPQEVDPPYGRDPGDQPFLALARAAAADALVSGDDHLVSLAESFAFEILRPSCLHQFLIDRGKGTGQTALD